jgi:hypothetical protein
MTPDEVVLAARRRYNSVNDTFWSDDELYNYIYAGCLEASDEAYAIRRTYETTTVASTQGYDFPSNVIAIKRASWNGRKLTKVDMIEDDLLTGLNQDTTEEGDPQYYWIWNDTIYLRPVPASAEELKLWTYNEQSAITTGTQDIEIPTQHHMRLVTYVLACMADKDENYAASDRLFLKWEKDKLEIRKSLRKMERADKFTTVKDEESIVEISIGGS